MNPLSFLQKKKSAPVIPYSAIAFAYDDLMCHVNYRSWAGYLDKLIARFGNGGRRIVDGCCGTGKMMVELSRKEYAVCGFDLSLEMLHQAGRNGLFSLWQGDLKNLSLKPNWDVFLCLYDSIQYLSVSELDSVFNQVSRCLLPEGVFIFDIVTEHHVLKYWANYTESMHFRDQEILRQSWYNRPKKMLHTVFEVTEDKGRAGYQEHHRQSVFTLSEIEDCIRQSRFELVGMFEDFGFQPGEKTSDRIHFVLRKESF
jgi:ubiquinone/menaquinone biosynthesis C-methylase UbiE